MCFNWAKGEATSVFLQHPSLVVVGSIGLYLAFGNTTTLQNGNGGRKSVDSCNPAAYAAVSPTSHETLRLHLYFLVLSLQLKAFLSTKWSAASLPAVRKKTPQWTDSFKVWIYLCLLQVMADFLHESSIVSSLDREFFVFKVERAAAWITLPIHCTIWHHSNTSQIDESHSNHFIIIRVYISVIEQSLNIIFCTTSDLSAQLKPNALRSRFYHHFPS